MDSEDEELYCLALDQLEQQAGLPAASAAPPSCQQHVGSRTRAVAQPPLRAMNSSNHCGIQPPPPPAAAASVQQPGTVNVGVRLLFRRPSAAPELPRTLPASGSSGAGLAGGGGTVAAIAAAAAAPSHAAPEWRQQQQPPYGSLATAQQSWRQDNGPPLPSTAAAGAASHAVAPPPPCPLLQNQQPQHQQQRLPVGSAGLQHPRQHLQQQHTKQREQQQVEQPVVAAAAVQHPQQHPQQQPQLHPPQQAVPVAAAAVQQPQQQDQQQHLQQPAVVVAEQPANAKPGSAGDEAAAEYGQAGGEPRSPQEAAAALAPGPYAAPSQVAAAPVAGEPNAPAAALAVAPPVAAPDAAAPTVAAPNIAAPNAPTAAAAVAAGPSAAAGAAALPAAAPDAVAPDAAVAAAGPAAPKRKLKQLFDFLVVYDLEATCDADKTKQQTPQEIIELSCVVVDTARLQVLPATFQRYCRPDQLTGITQDMVDAGIPLKMALQQHEAWLREQGLMGQGKSFIPVTWRDWDMKVMMAMECKWRGIEQPKFMRRWCDLSAVFFKHSKQRGNLRASVEASGLEWEGRAHSAIDDALNTARLAIKLMQSGIMLGVTGSFTGVDASGRFKQATLQLGGKPSSGGGGSGKASGSGGGGAGQQKRKVFDDAGLWSGLCYCGAKAKKRTVKKPGPNNGKDFWSCGRFSMTGGGAQCQFFKMADEVQLQKGAVGKASSKKAR